MTMRQNRTRQKDCVEAIKRKETVEGETKENDIKANYKIK